ncbi:MAG: N-acetyltransferase [Proteobacteria bacterium]|nr:N-acetyltransferase [Pseudomonadota bacterium]
MNEIEVRHEPAAARFAAEVEGGTAECAYRLRGGVMDIVHTEVPHAAEGRGVAAALVRAALVYARAQGLRVRPVCSYVQVYMRRHPDTQDLLER